MAYMTDANQIQPRNAPIYEAMVAHYHTKPASFHVPGHKSGQGVQSEAASFYQAIMSIDYTEITGLDDLHQPESVIMQAQQLAAQCFGAEETLFLVGGSTVGNLAMITSVCERDDLILVQRNVHKSVIHGLMLAGAKAVFLPPMMDLSTGLPTGVCLADVEQALRDFPMAKALFLSNPNYYGMGIGLKPFADLMHRYGKLLLVDEAHGAHYGFHPELPRSAIASGADAVVQSTHKMLTAMTMGAMLHLQGTRVNRAAIRRSLAILQSSSPSYPIMASLDLARQQMHTQGKELIGQGLRVVLAFSERLKELSCFGDIAEDPNQRGYETKDPFKISIYDKTGTLSGPQLKDKLERQGCFVEMADPRFVLLLFTVASTLEDAERIFQSLKNICDQHELQKKELLGAISNINSVPPFTQISAPITFSLSAFGSNENSDPLATAMVSLEEAVGQRSADMVIPYPPGIPLLYPGEAISMATVQYLQELASLGIRFHGTAAGQLHKIKVIRS
jgi:arginine decarboxylase